MTMTMSKPKRNTGCFCGSGKKYKVCHLVIERVKEHTPILGVFDPMLPIKPPKLKEWLTIKDARTLQPINTYPYLQAGNYPCRQQVNVGNGRYVERVVWCVIRDDGKRTPQLTGEHFALALQQTQNWETMERRRRALKLGGLLGGASIWGNV